jgi:DNA-binding response OmpR family regulator
MTIPNLAGRSILIIEDEALIALDLAQAFERAGAHITTTSTLHHAHLLVKHDGLSAVVLDHSLSDGDTNEICKYLQDNGVPFVTYSGFGGSDLESGECLGVYISKPKPPEFVVAVVDHLLRSGAPFATNFASKEWKADEV